LNEVKPIALLRRHFRKMMGFAAVQPILRANPRPALLADVRHDARSGLVDDGSDRRHQRAKDGDVVARRMNDDHRKRKTLEALLDCDRP